MQKQLLLGVGREIITPPIGTELYGYMPGWKSESVHDDLTVTALYFSYGEKRTVLISATVASMNTSISDEICKSIEKTYGIAREHCVLHCTHTHSAPNLTGTVGWGEIDTCYYNEIFLPRLLAAVDSAIRKAVPVKMGIAEGKSEIGINRRELRADNSIALGQNPWGPYNPAMTVLSFADGEGRAVANLIHYGMHGTCAGMNREISRDWSGVMIDMLERESGAVTCFFNGPEGDVGPRLANGQTVGDIRYVEAHGAWAGNEAVRIWRKIRSYQAVSMDCFAGSVRLPLEKRIGYEEAKHGCETHCDTVNLAGAKAHYFREQLRLYEEGYEDAAERVLPQTLVRIGEAVFISSPFELFSEIGMRISKHSPIPYALTLSNTNGSEGYLVTEDQVCRGGYEVDMFKHGYFQPYADHADWHMVRDSLKNIENIVEED